MGVLSDRQIEKEVKINPPPVKTSPPGVLSFGLTSYGVDLRCGYVFKVFTPVGPRGTLTLVDPKAFDTGSLVTVDLTPQPHLFDERDQNGYWWRNCLRPECPSKELASRAVHRDDWNKSCIVPPPYIDVPPHSYVLTETIEHVEVPRDCLAIVLGKSTYARCGIVTPLTPLEPEWRGKVTVEISNQNPLPARVYAGEGIFQVVFLRADTYTKGLTRIIEDMISVLSPREMRAGLERQLEHHTDWVNASCGVSYADKKGKYQDQPGLTLPVVNKE